MSQKYYTLYNKSTDKCLVHPQVGLWYTTNLKEAEDMLETCLEYVNSFKIDGLENNFCIIDAETHEVC